MQTGLSYLLLTAIQKTISGLSFTKIALHDDRFSQFRVDAVSAILYGYYAAAPTAGYHRDRFATIAAQGEQKRVEFLVIRFDPLNDVGLSFLCGPQVHTFHPIQFSL